MSCDYGGSEFGGSRIICSCFYEPHSTRNDPRHLLASTRKRARCRSMRAWLRGWALWTGVSGSGFGRESGFGINEFASLRHFEGQADRQTHRTRRGILAADLAKMSVISGFGVASPRLVTEETRFRRRSDFGIKRTAEMERLSKPTINSPDRRPTSASS